MPYDGNPENYVTKAAPVAPLREDWNTVPALRDWLAMQDGNKTYCYTSCGDCLLHRYFSACGIPVRTINPRAWRDSSFVSHSYPKILNEIVHDTHSDLPSGNTYAAALDRCNAIIGMGE